MTSGPAKLWILWLLITLALVAYLGYRLLAADDSSIFLLGQTSHGHHQIELACSSCHTSSFGGGEVLQEACVNCHGAALRASNDDHPRSKFTDPRNADRLQHIDARYCVTCHREHKPDITAEMGVTEPDDFCVHCHAGIAESRPSHAGMEFNSCATAGCHNYHDNSALYEDFLISHAGEADFHGKMQVPQRTGVADSEQRPTLTLADIDMPAHLQFSPDISAQWQHSAHAESGVNCSDCHGAGDSWVQTPDHQSCRSCHQLQVDGFLSGMHGMRLAVGLPAMQPKLSWRAMKPDMAEHQLGCNSCHNDHRHDTVNAAVDACLGCHADEHSTAYKNSAHFRLWQQEQRGELAPGSGVSCATCHLPRETHQLAGVDQVTVQHNQNSNLRPVEKMARTVCMHCHGLGFTLDALADPGLRANNFHGRPHEQVPGIRMAEERLRLQQQSRQNGPERR